MGAVSKTISAFGCLLWLSWGTVVYSLFGPPCLSQLGLRNGPSDHMLTFELSSSSGEAANIRLNGPKAWRPQNISDSFLQINISQPVLLTGLQIQGDPGLAGRITAWSLETSFDCDDYRTENYSVEFFNPAQIQTVLLQTMEFVSCVRLRPTHYKGKVPALRMELLGCVVSDSSGCDRDVHPVTEIWMVGGGRQLNFDHEVVLVWIKLKLDLRVKEDTWEAGVFYSQSCEQWNYVEPLSTNTLSITSSDSKSRWITIELDTPVRARCLRIFPPIGATLKEVHTNACSSRVISTLQQMKSDIKSTEIDKESSMDITAYQDDSPSASYHMETTTETDNFKDKLPQNSEESKLFMTVPDSEISEKPTLMDTQTVTPSMNIDEDSSQGINMDTTTATTVKATIAVTEDPSVKITIKVTEDLIKTEGTPTSSTAIAEETSGLNETTKPSEVTNAPHNSENIYNANNIKSETEDDSAVNQNNSVSLDNTVDGLENPFVNKGHGTLENGTKVGEETTNVVPSTTHDFSSTHNDDLSNRTDNSSISAQSTTEAESLSAEGTEDIGNVTEPVDSLEITEASLLLNSTASGSDTEDMNTLTTSENVNETAANISTPAASAIICGVKNSVEGTRKKRVVGGYLNAPGEWPWLVSMHFLPGFEFTRRSGFKHVCGASLVAPDWIITAAHCFAEDIVTGLSNVSNWRIYFGLHDLARKDGDQSFVQERLIKAYYPYPFFDLAPLIYDLALVKLNEPVQLTERVSPVCLDDSERHYNTSQCYVTGWGQVTTDSPGSRYPYSAALTTLELSECKAKYDRLPEDHEVKPYIQIKPPVMCATVGKAGEDACQGDSGGPLMCEHEGRWYQAGIVAAGFECGNEDYPGLYTRVKYYVSWIRKIMELYTDD